MQAQVHFSLTMFVPSSSSWPRSPQLFALQQLREGNVAARVPISLAITPRVALDTPLGVAMSENLPAWSLIAAFLMATSKLLSDDDESSRWDGSLAAWGPYVESLPSRIGEGVREVAVGCRGRLPCCYEAACQPCHGWLPITRRYGAGAGCGRERGPGIPAWLAKHAGCAPDCAGLPSVVGRAAPGSAGRGGAGHRATRHRRCTAGGVGVRGGPVPHREVRESARHRGACALDRHV